MPGVNYRRIADSASHAAAEPFAGLFAVLALDTVVFLIGHVVYEAKSVPKIRVIAGPWKQNENDPHIQSDRSEDAPMVPC